jgi:hypothetical protein
MGMIVATLAAPTVNTAATDATAVWKKIITCCNFNEEGFVRTPWPSISSKV